MKKFLFLLLALPLCTLLKAQDLKRSAVMKLLTDNSAAAELSSVDTENLIISSAYFNKSTGTELVYLQQSFKGLPVLNQIQVLSFKQGQIVSNAGGRIKAIEEKVNTSAIPAVPAEAAVQTAAAAKKIPLLQNLAGIQLSNKIEFGKMGVARENITATLMWVPTEDGKVRLAWQIYLVPKTTPDYFLIRVDAVTNTIISETNLTDYCNWLTPQNNGIVHQHNDGCTETENYLKVNNTLPTQTGPTIINGATYRVIPFPAESPTHPGGAPALRTDPWNAAPGNATTLKWHSTGTVDYTITRGNNVYAQEDLDANNNTPGFSPASTTPDPLTFDFVPNFGVTPTQRTPVPNQQFAITNLFYWNNIIHDVMYQYGFDEVSGNFQANNLGRGGLGNDFVFADAQDGNFVSPNQNNANFSTPADGGNPRMQMYLFDSIITLTVNSPQSIAGSYEAVESGFSPFNKLSAVGPISGQVVYYNDNTGSTHEACVPPSNSLSGKIALIVRGNCNFTVKVKNAQNAGAIAVIVINNVPGSPIVMGGGPDSTIIIPAIMVSDVTGALLVSQLANNVTVTLQAGINRDGDLDNGIIVHEFGHGISNRLTGGPTQAGCVSNAEHMGEGWSDYYGLMLTQDWANSNVNTGFTSPRGIGTYTLGQPPSGLGFRSQRYSTNFAINNKVYAATLPTQVHARGEIWAATLWDMTWNIIQQVNSINPNIYNVAGGGGNVIALRLVTEGLKLQPCGPGFIDGRDAILRADQILYNGAYSCAIKEAFRRRGMGALASQGSAGSVTDQVPDFSPSLTLNLSANVSEVPEGQNIVYTNTVSGCSAVTNYLITDTLPANVTYVSGGTYNATTRVVSFNVNLTQGQTQSYTFTVMANAGSYFPTTTIYDEPFATTTLPATLTATSTTATTWLVTNTQSHSAPNSAFTANTDVPSEQILTSSAFTLGATPTQLSFWHLYNTEAGYDGGVVEISTDGGSTWIDAGEKMNLNRYNGVIDPTAGTSIAGRPAFTGNSVAFIKTSVNLSSYVGQSARFRWKFVTDAGTAGVGWFVDDINIKSEPLVFMRSTLLSNTGVRLAYDDTVTLITQNAVCVNITITTQPQNVNGCTGASVTLSVVASGTSPTYQWQVSTDGGATYSNITGATAASLTLSGITAGMNNNRYRVIVSNGCPSTVTSTAAILTVSTPAAITSQPANVTVCTGANASFAVTASGTNLTYQWQVSTDGGITFSNIPGAIGATFNITGVTAAMNGNQYRVIISSCGPNVTSSNATLTVNSPATITTQPANTNGCTGGNATFSVVATGTGNTYQWQVSTDGGVTFANIPGATNATLNLTGITALMNNNRYRVIINGSCTANVVSNSATLTVSNTATITTQPVSTSACTGTNATFTAVASGASYQWQVSTDGGVTFTNIPGATSTTLTITGVTAAMNNNQYRLVVTSCSATPLNSNAATLTVNISAAIITQPSNATVCIGSNATFTVVASGTSLTYQWQVSTDGGATYTNIAGATSATLTVSNATAGMNNNRYRVIIGNSCPAGVTSTGAVLSVNNVTTISSQPTNSATCAGNNATFSVTVVGSGVTYQWQVSTDGGTTFTNIPGETNSSLTLNGVSAAMNNNRYRAVINGCGSLTSNAATLTVNPLPVVTISANPSTRILQGGTTTLTANTSATITSYTWLKDGVAVAGAAGNSLVVNFNSLGNYSVRVADANGCINVSNTLQISDSTFTTAFIYPNPSNGRFNVRYTTGSTVAQKRFITVYDGKGARVYNKENTVTGPSELMEVSLFNAAAGVHMVILSDAQGKILAKGKVMIY